MSTIELLIYITLVGISTIIFTSFTVDVIKNSVKSLTVKEVDQSARFLISRITQEIKTARSINSVSLNQIDLTDAAGNPITFSFDNANDLVNYNDGTGNVQISNETARVTNLEFEQISGQAIEIRLEVAQKNPTASQNHKHQIKLSSIVAPRPQLY